jgi:hypothetical protein
MSPAPIAAPPKRSNAAMVALVVVLVMLTLAIGAVAVAIVMTHPKVAAPVAVSSATTETITHDVPPATSTAEIVAATAPIITTLAPTTPTEFRVGGMVQAPPGLLYDDAIKKFNGDLARDLDKCLPPRSGEHSATANVVAQVAPDGTVKSARPLYITNPGPVFQCFLDAIARQRFVATKSGGQIIFTLMWKHA